jgi:hypothetical protein
MPDNFYNVEWFVDLIEIGAVKLPELQGQYQSIQNKAWRMEHRKQELERLPSYTKGNGGTISDS